MYNISQQACDHLSAFVTYRNFKRYAQVPPSPLQPLHIANQRTARQRCRAWGAGAGYWPRTAAWRLPLASASRSNWFREKPAAQNDKTTQHTPPPWAKPIFQKENLSSQKVDSLML